jgi:hypothetical protein
MPFDNRLCFRRSYDRIEWCRAGVATRPRSLAQTFTENTAVYYVAHFVEVVLDIVIAQGIAIVRVATRGLARTREIVLLLVSWTYELARRALVQPQGIYKLFSAYSKALLDAFSQFGVN